MGASGMNTAGEEAARVGDNQGTTNTRIFHYDCQKFLKRDPPASGIISKHVLE